MTDIAQLLPHVDAFPHALGCGIIARSAAPVSAALHRRLAAFIDGYERALSRFRADSTVAQLASGRVCAAEFPAWTADLFALADRLAQATGGAIDPCVGEALVQLGYGIELGRAFRGEPARQAGAAAVTASAASAVPTVPAASAARTWDDLRARSAARPQWLRDVRWEPVGGDPTGSDPAPAVMLRVRRPMLLDFGACGKGYLVDLLAGMLRDAELRGPLVIDAGGDMRIEGLDGTPLRIGLEDPADAARAVGVAQIGAGSLCASSPSRRRWPGAHHLINALDGRPANDVAASWAFVRHDAPDAADASDASSLARSLARRCPTAAADGLATALFVADPAALREAFPYDCALLDAGRGGRASAGFPGALFLRRPQ